MAVPSSRYQFREFILRKLGHPVIEINVDDDQIEDRIDEALSYYADYHYSGSKHTYLKHQITADDISNGYVTLPDSVIGVVQVLQFNSISAGSGMFNVRYQFMMNNMSDLTSGSLTNYIMSSQQLALIEQVIGERPSMRYNRHSDKLYIDVDWSTMTEGNWLVLEAYLSLDQEVDTDMWADRWLQNYAAVLVQEQWGRNMSKFNGVQLIGGVTFNGEQILSEARDARQKMEDEMIMNYSLPSTNFYA